jgi:hypothetical protein
MVNPDKGVGRRDVVSSVLGAWSSELRGRVTIDAVDSPSAPSAFVNGVMEGASWVFQDGVWKIAEQTQSQMRKMTVKEI